MVPKKIRKAGADIVADVGPEQPNTNKRTQSAMWIVPSSLVPRTLWGRKPPLANALTFEEAKQRRKK